ncbi:glycoside hydrolase family 48 protein [Actinorugispora endophytica]|uniref:Cellulose 1,4-beta-cellobiosidase n=1 Tax=Actinorugispora endophytica TaxID=1605990 RepID=A0A4R6URP6_9ACTN|nr:glycoside hydrolase family 48 protein [Actinorugispora endophytica]TDQ45984.1 cellulose 1,4-beta-cellobiosidase [Actinorugispora endophytica]
MKRSALLPRRRRTLLPGTLAAALAAALLSPGTAHAAVACSVDYDDSNDWGSGFTADITVTNEGGDPIPDWSVGWTFPGNQQVTNGWNGVFAQSGADVTVRHPSWNSTIAPGSSVSFGFQGAYSGSNDAPTSFTVNGAACGGPPGENTAPEVSLTSPADGTSFLVGDTVDLAADASDPDGGVDRVEFAADGEVLGTDTTAPYSLAWDGAAAGPYSLTATAYDDEDASTVSSPVDIQVLDSPAVLASPSTTRVRRGESTDFEVILSNPPSGTVTAEVERASGSADLSVSDGAELEFTSGNWDEPQAVTIASAANGGDLAEAVFTVSAPGHDPAEVTVREIDESTSAYDEAFLEQYEKIKDPASGYFRDFDGLLVPYHSVETMVVEAPDHGHQTTSEAFSYYLWLEAYYGRVTGDWGPLRDAWESMEAFIIPGTADQPTNGAYNPDSPATYIPEHPNSDGYPSALDPGVPTGSDPIADELSSTYGTDEVYGMHWLLDVDNVYGFGFCGDGTDDAPAYMNSYQRGSRESVWETVPHPSCEDFSFGDTNGYLELFTDDEGYAEQWRYTNAPDADARAVQVMFWAQQWAEEQGNEAEVAGMVDNAAKMGDYLRYAMFDKYFKEIGDCVGATACPGGSGKDSAHYLMSWYYAWGGALDTSAPWAFRIGSSASHQGYQNVLAAYALSQVPELQPESPTGVDDWSTSFDRQLEFLQWLQSAEGGLAGGATNSWGGGYGTPPSGLSQFYGMYYDWQPVWNDPPSNNWFGFQVWNMERVAQLYQVTGDPRAEAILDKWVPWAVEHTDVDADGGGADFRVPSDLEWSGQPDTWNGTYTGNPDLHVEVATRSQDVGVAASLAKTLLYYSERSGDTGALATGEGLLDALLAHQDAIGIATPEQPGWDRMDDPWDGEEGLYVPEGFSGTMPNGDAIEPGATFLSIRSFYEDDPLWPEVEAHLNDPENVEAPILERHRFWSQVEIATAFAAHDELFGAG